MVFFITGCNQPELTASDYSSNTKQISLSEKPSAELAFSIHPIQVNEYNFLEVSGWYDEEHLLYLSDESGVSKIYKHHIYSGSSELFYEYEDPIAKIEASKDQEFFAIHTVPITNSSDLQFVDREGNLVYAWENTGISFDVYWNPYSEDTVIIGEMDEDFHSSLHVVNLRDGSLHTDTDAPYYVQWLNEEELSYLAWEDHTVGFEAPIKQWVLHGDNDDNPVVQRNVITYFSLYDHKYVTVKMDEDNPHSSIYQVYEYDNQKPLFSWDVDTLMTYSSEWWIPYFTYSEDYFYYFHPKEHGDVYEYNEGFDLHAIQLNDGKQETIMDNVKNQEPMVVSPDGFWLLKGQQLEKVISTRSGKEWDLLIF